MFEMEQKYKVRHRYLSYLGLICKFTHLEYTDSSARIPLQNGGDNDE